MALEGGHRFIKYMLIIFNFIFLLAGLALIIVGAVAAAKLSPYSTVAGVHFNGVGIFIIVIGIVIFLISLFGCLGAYKENYCLLITFVILMIVSLLALIAAIITAFVMKNQVKSKMEEGLNSTIPKYKKDDKQDVVTKLWDEMQSDLHCCGSNSSSDWRFNDELYKSQSVPDSCCKIISAGCGNNRLTTGNGTYTKGCVDQFSDPIFKNVVAVGGAAAAIAILQFVGIIFACCLVNAIRKEYSTV